MLKGPGSWSLMRGGDEQGLGPCCLLFESGSQLFSQSNRGRAIPPASGLSLPFSKLGKEIGLPGLFFSALMWLERCEDRGAMQRGPHARLPPWLAQVLIVRSTTITLTPSSETDVSLVYRGFIHPLLPGGPGGPGAEDVAVWARAQRLHVLARMARGPDTENMVRVPGTCRGLFMVNMGAWMCGGEEEWGEIEDLNVNNC